jgi:hypothetical protein
VGGKLLFSCPEKQIVFGISAGVPTSIEKACPGPIHFDPCFKFLIDAERFAPSPVFGGKLPLNEYPVKESILEELSVFSHQSTGYELLLYTLKEIIINDFRYYRDNVDYI